jgi:hypothetical protein
VKPDEEGAAEWFFGGNSRWPYDKYLRTYFLKPLRHSFIRQAHDRTLDQLREDLVRPARSRAWLLPTVDRIEQAGAQGLFECVDRVSTRKRAECFMGETGIDRAHVEALLDFVKRWIIPYPAQLRQLFDPSDQALLGHFEKLKEHKIANSYALLEQGRTKPGREALAAQTGVPESVILDFVHRADITRLPFTSGRIVNQLWAIGYTSLEQLRNANPAQFFERVNEYYSSHGKGMPFDSTAEGVKGFIEAAVRLPTVVQE